MNFRNWSARGSEPEKQGSTSLQCIIARQLCFMQRCLNPAVQNGLVKTQGMLKYHSHELKW